jgi:hypothetical protein
MAGQIFLSEQAEETTAEQYDSPEVIDIEVQNPNLLLTSDHEHTYPFERPSWGGMVVYLNTIMKWYEITPQSNMYFSKSHLSPMIAAPGLYLGNQNKKNMGWIKVNKLKNLMQERNIDVESVELPSILESTQYKRELFLIQGFVRREDKLRKDKNGVPDPVSMWKASRGNKDDDSFYDHNILLEPLVGRYIDHVLPSINVCLILNPESHLRLHDNLEGGVL